MPILSALRRKKAAKPQSPFKSARRALIDGDLVVFANAAESEIPRLLGVLSRESDAGPAVRDWILEACSLDEASARVIAEIEKHTFLPDTGAKLSKWLLSCGMFTAALTAEANFTATLQDALKRASPPPEKAAKWTAMAALQSSDREALRQVALAGGGQGRRSAPSSLSWGEVARIALGEVIPRAGDEWFSRLVAGRSVGVLGPAPTSEEAVQEVKSCDLLVVPVRQSQTLERLRVDDGADIAYAFPWAGDAAVDWARPGVLVLRDGRDFSSLTGHSGPVRRAKVPPGAGFVGMATALPDIVVDLLGAGASDIRVAGANFYISEDPAYRIDEAKQGRSEWNNTGTPFSGTLQFSSHPPIENRNFLRTMMLSGKCRLVDFESVLTMADHAAAKVLESAWSLPRR